MTKKSDITLSTSEKVSMVSNLSTMLSAGITILDAVDSILEDARGNQRKVLEALREDLMQGKQVHASWAGFPRVFDRVTVSLIRASEQAGTLETTLKDLKENILKEVEFLDKVKFAMIYPTLVVVVFAGVLVMILTFVVPRIARVFERLQVELPLPTKILIGLSDILLGYTWHLAGVVAVTGGVVWYLYRAKREMFTEMLSSLPGISELVKQIDLTRFSRSLFLLLSSGLPITQALDLAQDVVIKRKMVRLITQAQEMVMSGKRLSEGFRDSKGYIPTMMVKLIEVGEKSGSLDKSMQEIGTYLDYQVTNTLKTLTAILEPVMLVVVGISVGSMMLSIIAPIYGLIGQIGAR